MINTVFQRLEKDDAIDVDTKSLLVRCVMQFGRERQLHAQQAATYVRGLGDTWESHRTVPMLSGSMLQTTYRMFGTPVEATAIPVIPTSAPQPGPAASDAVSQDPTGAQANTNSHGLVDVDDDDDDDDDNTFLPVTLGGYAHQVDDYLHRGDSLRDINFYEFVKYCKLVPEGKRKSEFRHTLAESHPNHPKQVHRYTPHRSEGIPRAIFRTFPRPDGTERHGESYCAAMLSHFRPFSLANPLKDRGESYEEAFARTNFHADAVRIMSNWQALTECDDARDADQLLRRKREAARAEQHDAEALRLATACAGDDPNADITMAALLKKKNHQSVETMTFVSNLAQSGWFDSTSGNGTEQAPVALAGPQDTPPMTDSRRRQWAKEQALLEAQVKADQVAPKANRGVLAEDLGFPDQETPPKEGATTTDEAFSTFGAAPPTKRLEWNAKPPHELINTLIKERGLNASQSLAFRIAARSFFEQLHGLSTKPLRLLMHGEAGTGKTVVVRLLRELLDRYGKGSEILFMAPTGKAACAIGGSTQHSTFALDVRRRGTTTDETTPKQDQASARRLRHLQEKFRSIRWMFFDEVSMTSCETMCDIDQAMRMGTQKLDEPFGGINVIFAGDLCQLPPILASPLYKTSSSPHRSAEIRTRVELGRAVWLQITSVVDFTHQMRMQDEQMAATLSRLRVRACTQIDADVLNSNVLRSSANPDGASLSLHSDAIALARTNETVRTLNLRKASTQAASKSKALAISNAADTSPVALTEKERQTLLSFNGMSGAKIGLGRIPLFVGMPVVYRGPNQSILLGVTNGAFATVVGWDLVQDKWGLTVPRGAILKFSVDAQWALTGLDKGCLPVPPTPSMFDFGPDGELERDGKQATRKVSRRQLPFQPGFAMTVHSAQGITSEAGVIVDLSSGGFEAYVAASRATKQDRVFLVSMVTVEQLNSPKLPETLQTELARLKALALTTQRQHDHDLWRLATNNKRTSPAESDIMSPSKRIRTDDMNPTDVLEANPSFVETVNVRMVPDAHSALLQE
ncbi:hypothetical protein CF319_g7030 [Tilletia indica]|nr:hypothetical protein CF319_g7030 [Tilletia indica]